MEIFTGVDDEGNLVQWEVDEDLPSTKPLYGKCTMSIRFQNHGQYLKWKECNYRTWEFVHTYPAIMQTEYEFHTWADVIALAKKVIQLMEMGFDVYTVNWKVAKEKSQLEVEK